MNRFFVENKVYEDRIEICKGCVYYYKPTGSCKICMCFMKIKARIANQSCPQKYWEQTVEVMKAPDDLPQEIIDAILNMWEDLKTGRAKNVQAKKKMIETYNTIYNTNYKTGTNCGSCISTCFDGIKNYIKNTANELPSTPKRNKMHYSSRWVVKYNEDLVKEVKLIYSPDEYRKFANARPLHSQDGLIKILENDKERRNQS